MNRQMMSAGANGSINEVGGRGGGAAPLSLTWQRISR